MAAAKKGTDSGEIAIMEVQRGELDLFIIGTSPLITNRMSQKVWHELLAPQGRKTAATKAQSLKHDPIQEFRDSPYIIEQDDSPTLIGVMASSFKKAMCTAALRTPGVNKTEIAQLVYVPGALIGVYGLPRVFMAITRSADMNKTPDVRTRALLPEWACRISISYVKPALRERSIANLIASAGLMAGIGDWRQEKGSGSYGSFRICEPTDPDFVRITQTMGREAQAEALQNPVPYNDETSEMLAWFDVEIKRRGFPLASGPKVPAAVDEVIPAAKVPRRGANGSAAQPAAVN
jgi:hypothetical protein